MNRVEFANLVFEQGFTGALFWNPPEQVLKAKTIYLTEVEFQLKVKTWPSNKGLYVPHFQYQTDDETGKLSLYICSQFYDNFFFYFE